MRSFKVFLFSFLSLTILGLFSFEVFAALYLNVDVGGNVGYYAQDIGAKIWGTSTTTISGEQNSSYLNLVSSNGSTENVSNYVYSEGGSDSAYLNITANVGDVQFETSSDTIVILVFIKNVGDRYLLPSVNITASSSNLLTTTETLYFDADNTAHIDALTKQTENLTSALTYTNLIATEINNQNCNAFNVASSSIDNNDTFVSKTTISLQNVDGNGAVLVNNGFSISISFYADVQYDSNNILSIYQEQDSSSSDWYKYGVNSDHSDVSATKVETNSLSTLASKLGTNGYAEDGTINYGSDWYSEYAPVYSEIDTVNVDIYSGEIIGKLSDVNYNFEWFGGDVTLPAGTTLASGRTLTETETFTVDVYTYYPTMYVRRWMVGTKQWISISDSAENFIGCSKIDAYYTATFEATTFNPDKTIATNSEGEIITRSYVFNYTPLVSGINNYLITNYNFKNYYINDSGEQVTVSDITSSTTQTKMLTWANNLTSDWKKHSLYGSSYATASACQGENYTKFIYNLLYLVKYANNNSQEVVGYGNTYTYSLYNNATDGVTTESGNVITTNASTNSYYESEKGGGTIGVYNSSAKGTASYNVNTDGAYKLSVTDSNGADVYNSVGLNYGYNYLVNNYTGLYTHQFLTKTTTINGKQKRYVADGYVGSDKYTSVFCLGVCNPWGNVYTWAFGTAVLYDGANFWTYVNFNNYNPEYENGTTYNLGLGNYMLSSNSSGFEINNKMLLDLGYVRLSYNLPTTAGYYRTTGVSNITDSVNAFGESTTTTLQTLVGFPTSTSLTGGSGSGLCDYYYCSASTSNVFGVLCGGSTNDITSAGAFYFCY